MNWRIENRVTFFQGFWVVSESENDPLVPQEKMQSQLRKTKAHLSKSRELNENLASKYLKIQEQCGELMSTSFSDNLGLLKEEDKYELAAIDKGSKFDGQFLATCILILYGRDSNEILKLTAAGRTYAHSTEPAKTIEPKKLLFIKNLFCERARGCSKDLKEAETRKNTFRKLLSSSIRTAKARVNKISKNLQ